MAGSGEMPFLDHLEELRIRLIKALGAVIVGFGLGLWVVERFQLVSILKRPIAPYLPAGGKLVFLGPTEPVMIVLKLAFVVGLVLASPVILYQVWNFLAPALYERERKAVVPALLIGLLLFLVGAVLGYVYVVPQALRVLFSFQSEALAPFITYDNYFSFVVQVALALGISFELPLIIILLSWLGLLTPGALNRFRRFAIVLACIAGAVLSPGTDVISMAMMTVPLLFLYEVGFLGSVLVHRRRKHREAHTAALIFLIVLAGAGSLAAQVPPRPRKPIIPGQVSTPADTTPPGARRDTLRAAGQVLDSAAAARLGLPTGPTRTFPANDSVLTGLLERPGYQAIRYKSDSATLFADDRRILLHGEGITQRGQSVLEADDITYDDDDCLLMALGNPRLFDGPSILVAERIRYNTCEKRAVVADALTNFQQGSVTWFLRGDLAQDSSSSRLYASSGEITSCDLPVPHYHFSAHEVKWISKTVLVARPAVLYVRDVPILWLPFIFQDARPGRRSGILVPQFGLNDIVRPNPGYNRQVTNIGYYWAPNAYVDVTARLDWYANRYVQIGAYTQYRWINRFLNGTLAYSRTSENTGRRTTAFRWDHHQSFNLSTTLNLNFNYLSNSSVLRRNALDPLLATQEITSALNFTKRFGWGSLTLGGNRRQSLSDRSVRQQFPALTISPKPLDLSQSITWSPALTFTNDIQSNTPQAAFLLTNPVGGIDTVRGTADSRTTAFSLETPLRFGGFNWRNSVRMTDQHTTARQVVTFKVDDPSTPNPTDSLTVTRVYDGNFSTGFDWNTGINLPTLFRGTFKLQPVLAIDNVVPGQPFALRNRNTGGNYVLQTKRFAFTMSAAPTFFGFFPGFGPIGRIRHSISPILTWSYRPAADVPRDFAEALVNPGQPVQLRSDPSQTASLSLSQTFEGKPRQAPGDTTDPATLRKFRMLNLATSGVAYDFEQAKKPGRTGWTTQTLSNTFQSDLLPGFNLSLTHDLWKGRVGYDSTKFSPFLQSVSASFALTGNTFRSVLGIFGLGGKRSSQAREQEPPPPSSYAAGAGQGRSRTGAFFNTDQATLPHGRTFTANLNYSLNRIRPIPGDSTAAPARQNLGFSTSFSPTPLWSLSWTAQYNITDGRFESHVVRLERDMHEWRASFNVSKGPNGNFQLFFTIFLSDLPTIKFDYDQSTIQR